MIRTLKTICAANLVIAILFVGGYILYGLSHGLSIERFFLGSNTMHRSRGGGQPISTWKFMAFAESAILIAFIIGRFTPKDFKVDRAMCLFFGGVGIFSVVSTSLLSSTYTGDEFAYLHASQVDCLLGLYVYLSHLLYGLSGAKNA
jgi:hypothetical protein